jgi:hypothetical protein
MSDKILKMVYNSYQCTKHNETNIAYFVCDNVWTYSDGSENSYSGPAMLDMINFFVVGQIVLTEKQLITLSQLDCESSSKTAGIDMLYDIPEKIYPWMEGGMYSDMKFAAKPIYYIGTDGEDLWNELCLGGNSSDYIAGYLQVVNAESYDHLVAITEGDTPQALGYRHH